MTAPTPEQAAKLGRRMALDPGWADAERRAELISDALIDAREHGQVAVEAAADLGREIDRGTVQLRLARDEIERRLDAEAGPWPTDESRRVTEEPIPDHIADEIIARMFHPANTEQDDTE